MNKELYSGLDEGVRDVVRVLMRAAYVKAAKARASIFHLGTRNLEPLHRAKGLNPL